MPATGSRWSFRPSMPRTGRTRARRRSTMPPAWRIKRRPTSWIACRLGVVIACDTIVECGGEILGKPADVADARRMLSALSGQVHHVYSGLCVWPRPDGRAGDSHGRNPAGDESAFRRGVGRVFGVGQLGRQVRRVWLSGSARLAASGRGQRIERHRLAHGAARRDAGRDRSAGAAA